MLQIPIGAFFQFEDQRRSSNQGSGGDKLIILMTDGLEDWAEDVIENFVPFNPDGTRNVTVRISNFCGKNNIKFRKTSFSRCMVKHYYTTANL